MVIKLLLDFPLNWTFDHINAFKEAIQLQSPLTPILKYISTIPLHQFPMHIFDDLESLEPFGNIFLNPVFYCPPITIKQFQTFGNNNEHLKITINKKEEIAFFKSDLSNNPKKQPYIEFLYTTNWYKKDFLIQDLRFTK